MLADLAAWRARTGSTLIAASSSTQAFSHLPQPVQDSACTTGSKMACLPVRVLCVRPRA